MTTMIERVARAICQSQTQGAGFWKAFVPEAEAAIAATREPTKGMLGAMTGVVTGVVEQGAMSDEDPGTEYNDYLDDEAAREVFISAIDAALEEKP